MSQVPQTIAARFTGQSVARKEDRRLVTGHGRYVDDVQSPGHLHAAFLRSEVASARLAAIDRSAAEALDGVVAVFTGEQLNGDGHEMYWGIMGPQMPMAGPLAPGRVLYVGDPIAVVVADNRYVAEDAVDLIEVEYEPAPPVVDYRQAAGMTEQLVHPEAGSNAMVAVPFTPLSPDLEAAFSKADHVVEATIESHRYIAVPMEPRGILAAWHPGTDELDVVISTQSVHEVRSFCARMLAIPEASVSVTMRDVGGGFGSKMLIGREEAATVLAAHRLGVSVKWIEDRRENLIAAPHSRNERAVVRVAVDDDGTIQGIAADSQCDLGAYPAAGGPMDHQLLPGPYKIPRLGFSVEMTWSNTMGKGPYRGPWMFETTAREMVLDIVARRIGMDPAELRRRNILRSTDLPFTSPGMKEFQEITPGETLDQALEMVDYEGFRKEQEAARREGRYLGVGIACYVEPTTMAFPGGSSEGATVRVEQSGKVSVYLSTSSHGQSVETTMAQLVADELGVDYDDVSIVQGDTRSTPYGAGTGGSRTATLAGGAAHAASVTVRDKIIAIAAHLMEAAPEDLELVDGRVSVRGTPSRGMALAEVAQKAYISPDTLPLELGSGLEATERFRPNRYPTWSNATHVCVVEVDDRTWEPRVLRYIVSEDCGRMINPRIVEGQIAGGVVQGLGGVLLENFVYDGDGNPLTTTFMDYLLPTATEVPDLEVGHIVTEATSNPGGFKGMGEGGAIGSHAAVANAVADALTPFGVTVTSTPLGPSQIFELVEAARS
jgi:carbon-monoxide dehydrogenase large subunit